MAKPLIFISNDDGIEAKGLKVLIDLMRPFGDVFVSAPHVGRSGLSQSLSLREPLTMTLVKQEPGLTIYSCDGTPVDCVKLAFNRFVLRKPDIFVSGINHGSNSSISAFYSGTVGTVIEAYFQDIPSMAFSLLSHNPDADFSIAKKYIPSIFEAVWNHPDKAEICLNVNFPNIQQKEAKGIMMCRQTNGFWEEDFLQRNNSRGETVYYMRGDFSNMEPDNKDTDEWALKNNYISIVPLSKDLTNYNILNKIKNWEFK